MRREAEGRRPGRGDDRRPDPRGFAKQQEGEFTVINDPFTDEKYGVGMRKGDTETCEAVNAAVTKMYEDGTAAKLLDKWFGGTGLKPTTTVPQFEGCA
ncbi:transporter substrate-binding domain-containing protein [Actinomadura sp. CNU-125]|uniref:transporter substrate-binding domain-containing protein n=1 Tax=Actinomadura sp. CNU-125 TaxID=1904961 RepID=UPI00396700B0